MKASMTLLCLIIALFATAETGSAQDAMLTKEETINYLQKKLLEVDGREQITEAHGRVTRTKYHNASITLKGNTVKLTIFTSFKDDQKPHFAIDGFNPAYISKVEVLKPKSDEGVGMVFLQFDRKVVKSTHEFMYYGKPQDFNFVFIPYYATIPQNGDRVMKAILHLRDLAKAEDDPFGN